MSAHPSRPRADRSPSPRPRRLRPLLLAALGALLAACASTPLPPGTTAWPYHQQAVADIDAWTLQGRLNVRGPEQNDTVNLNWMQEGERFSITLSRLGVGGARLEGDGRQVMLEKAGEEPVYAGSLEEISLEMLGYVFPASQLYYWIRGIPDPDASNRLVLNEQQRLASLAQDEWTLEYDRYLETAPGLGLPGRIRVDYAPYRLTFLISRWDIPADEQAEALETLRAGGLVPATEATGTDDTAGARPFPSPSAAPGSVPVVSGARGTAVGEP